MALVDEIKATELLPLQCGIWYLGQEGILLKNNGDYILIDPYLSDYVDKNCSESVPWKRLYPPPAKPSEFDFVSLVICTHAHYDHADPYTLTAIAKASPETKFVLPAPMRASLVEYGLDESRVILAKADETIIFKGNKITPIPAAHEELHTDELGNYEELGYVIENESGRFFHAGDMCPYDGLCERLADIDVAFLPINGRDSYRRSLDIIGNFTVEEAVRLASQCGFGLLIPVHYDLYEINMLSKTEFMSTVERVFPNQRTHTFTVGEKYIFAK